MAAPEYVPPSLKDQPRRDAPLPPAGRWKADRPADLGPGQPRGRQMGAPGPDQGYGLGLAKRFVNQLQLVEGEAPEDVISGCLAVALKRASLFGRAPVIYDFEFAYRLFGFLGGAPPDLVAFRGPLLGGSAHDYWRQREVADSVPESTLRLTPAQLAERLGEWRSLLASDPA